MEDAEGATVRGAIDVRRLLDRDGRVRQMPVRPAGKAAVLGYLVTKFYAGVRYSEREVNELLDAWHTFGDHTRLRRELCDAGLLGRLDDGSAYWVRDAGGRPSDVGR